MFLIQDGLWGADALLRSNQQASWIKMLEYHNLIAGPIIELRLLPKEIWAATPVDKLVRVTNILRMNGCVGSINSDSDGAVPG